MLDAFCIIFFCSLPWYKSVKEIPMTGMPLLFTLLACAWNLFLLPSSVYVHGIPSIYQIWLLVISVDFIQFFLHFSFHKKLFGLNLFNSHNVHHKAKNPTPKDAFSTGIFDSIIQLIIPIYLSIHLIKPNRTTVITFGLLYSQWLLYIHSEWSEISNYLVSPSYHKEHHKNQKVHFAHVFPLWDYLMNTC